ncbi:ATP synthase epsilon chain [Commensalibacter sp. Nvir]|uniref:ATP synthase F1 subunit epsilon n=1 Tax=Commensalibacter sp. Nvir TaxID=3069817 RepID=UPI002D388268|nr:ATP synthase epsilon chain [Commensalibacter sp. Nvir]
MSIQIEIISPKEVVLSQKVDMAVIPGLEGDIAAMEGRAPIILLLRGGIISLYEKDTVIQSLFIENGFAEMKESQCTVLVNKVIKLDEIDAEQANDRLVRLQAQYDEIASGKDAEAQRNLIDQIQGARVMKELATS